MERWEERARARARIRKAAACFSGSFDVVLGDDAIVVTVPPGGGPDAARLLAQLALTVRVELREVASSVPAPPMRAA